MKQGRDTLVAVCDAEILGKTLEGGRVPFKVKESFYCGVKGDIEEAIEAMSRGTICNLVGKNIVSAAIEHNLVHKNAVIFFGDVPHAQILRL
ncbi:MAG: DUF424 domain-containing protein [Candidatus Bathyarchaeia archaeon]